MAWKTIKLWLEHKEIESRTPKDALREALQQGLIDDGNAWSIMHSKRNLTTHTYNENTAKEVVTFIRNQGIQLFSALEQTFNDLMR